MDGDEVYTYTDEKPLEPLTIEELKRVMAEIGPRPPTLGIVVSKWWPDISGEIIGYEHKKLAKDSPFIDVLRSVLPEDLHRGSWEDVIIVLNEKDFRRIFGTYAADGTYFNQFWVERLVDQVRGRS